MNAMLKVCFVVALCAMSSLAYATVLFQDGFEDDAATASFTDTSKTYYPSNWTTVTGLSVDVMVYTAATTGDSAKPATIPQGNNALRLIKTQPQAPSITASWAGGQTKVSASFDIYLADYSTPVTNITIQLLDGSDNVGAYLLFSDSGGTGCDIQFNNGTSNLTIATGVPNAAWETMVINADATTHRFTLEYAGVTYDNNGSGYVFSSNINEIQKLKFMCATNNYYKTYIDNVVVQNVPEPVTASLLGLGGILALVWKRRRMLK